MLLLPAKGAAAHVREAEVLASDPPLLLAARGRNVLEWLLAHTARPGNSHAADMTPKNEPHSEQQRAETQGQLGDKGLVLKRMLALGYHGAALTRAFTGASHHFPLDSGLNFSNDYLCVGPAMQRNLPCSRNLGQDLHHVCSDTRCTEMNRENCNQGTNFETSVRMA
jgi:hypothetical protein